MIDERTFMEEVERAERTLYRVRRSLLSSDADCRDAGLAPCFGAHGALRSSPCWMRRRLPKPGRGTVFGVSAYSSSKASAVKRMLWTRLPLSP